MPKWFQSGDSNSPIFVQCLVTYQVGELRLFNFFNFEFFLLHVFIKTLPIWILLGIRDPSSTHV